MDGFEYLNRLKNLAKHTVSKLKTRFTSKDSKQELDEQIETTETMIVSTPLWRKKSTLIGGSALIIAAAIVIGVQQYQQYINKNTFEIIHVYQNNQYVGTVDEISQVEKLIDDKSLEVSNNHPGISMELNTGEFTYESEKGFKLEADTETTLSKLEQTFTSHAVGVAVVVNGKTLGYVKDEEAAANVLKRLQSQFVPQAAAANQSKQIQSLSYNTNDTNENNGTTEDATSEPQNVVKSVEFVEQIELTHNQISPSEIIDEEKLYQDILEGSTKPTKYIIQKGDCIGCIAEKFGISEQVIYENNPFIKGDRITAGDELDLTVRMPDITVRSVEQVVEIEEIAPPIEYVKNDQVREGQSKTLQQGKAGSQRLTYEITKENGYLITEELVNKEVIEEPTPTIIEKGTLVVAGTGSGKFAYPVKNYRISSKFGKRWGRQHAGIDFTGNKSILASDAGEVEYVGTKNGYGKTIIIDHKNGFKTLYGHLSSYDVSEGDKVEKGDKIGVMGNTGRSTGVHLHFEIWKNGTAVNPLSYL